MTSSGFALKPVATESCFWGTQLNGSTQVSVLLARSMRTSACSPCGCEGRMTFPLSDSAGAGGATPELMQSSRRSVPLAESNSEIDTDL